MKYFILDNKENKVVCNIGGYSNLHNAKEGRRSLSSPIARRCLRELNSNNYPVGEKFRNTYYAMLDEETEIIEVAEIIFKTKDGRVISQKV